MRASSDMPRSRRRVQRSRIGLAVLGVIVFVLLTSLRGIARFYTDYLWFAELGFTDVWRGVLGTKVFLGVLFTAAFFVVLVVNLIVADRLAPRFRPVGPEDEFVQRFRDITGRHLGKLRAGVALLFALFAGASVSGEWHSYILFRNAVDFGVDDPQFDTDVGFYVFRLPFLDFVVDWAFVSLVIVALITTGWHYLNGGIRLQAPVQRVTPQVKAHISVILGVLALVKAADYWLARFELNFSTRGAVQGATYTDVNAQLPALSLLLLISVFAAILLLVNIRLRGWVLPALAVGVWAFVAVIAATVYPAFIQKFRVQPAENRLERPYIERNIAATREALGIDDVEVRDFDYAETLTAQDLADNAETIRNVRLWDPRPQITGQSFERLQRLRDYYQFGDIDIDRYEVDGRITQMVVAVRELNQDSLPQSSWVNRHLQYTHGYGAALAPANAVTRDGRPNFAVGNVPPEGSPEITQPRVYYGTELSGFSIVGSDQAEFDYPTEQGSATSTYDGEGGVELSSWLRRVAFAARFADPNIVISNLVTPESRIIFQRSVTERVSEAAPFLRLDADPYPVIIDGRIKWIQDAYTTTSRYPYAQRIDTDRLPADSGLTGAAFNYVRNSVKAVVDAYDGSVVLYVVDDEDPIVQAYMKAFPTLFTAGSEMPEELTEHLRYPEDMFRVQTNMFGRYHITDPGEFFSAGDAWNVAQDPDTAGATVTAPPATTPAGAPIVSAPTRQRRMDPYYLQMKLPGDESESFLILQPFVPASSGRGVEQQNMAAFMVAKSDPGSYGKLEAFVMPRDEQVSGPAIVDARINADPEFSRDRALLDQRGSVVLQGNLLVVPIEQSLLYIRPLYVSSERNPLPEVKRVVVVYADRVVVRNTLNEALTEIFGEAPETLEETDPTAPGEPPPPDDETTAELLARAETLFAEAEAALREGDLATYQSKYRQGADLVREALARERPPATTPPPPSSA